MLDGISSITRSKRINSRHLKSKDSFAAVRMPLVSEALNELLVEGLADGHHTVEVRTSVQAASADAPFAVLRVQVSCAAMRVFSGVES